MLVSPSSFTMFPPQGEVNMRDCTLHNVGGNQYNFYPQDPLSILNPVIQHKNDVPGCMVGTRGSVFGEIDRWLNVTDSDSTPNVMLITGSPGVGKSAIASSLVSLLFKQGRLGSYFFFKRGDVDSGDPTALWRTVAYDLARFHPSLRSSVVGFLSRPGFRDTDILSHFECMVEAVLKNNHGHLSTNPPVIVLDALDECGTDDSAQRRILFDTLNSWSRLPCSFKLIVTSRDERVPDSFNDSRVCRKIILETGSVGKETHDDILLFFEKGFKELRPTPRRKKSWPGPLAIKKLTARAAGLFIWAKTAMKFMEQTWQDPDVLLRLVLTGDLGNQSKNIDTLYEHILETSFIDADDVSLALFRQIVGAIMVAKVPLHFNDLKFFLRQQDDENDWRIERILTRLSSVIEVDGLLRLRHLSFAEFLSDPKRCHQAQFVIDQSIQHKHLTLTCLREMEATLRFNICELESSHNRNKDMAGLSKKLANSIPFSLSYSCRFWAAHLCETTMDGDSIVKEVREFLHVRLLYWLEVMSLIKEIPASSVALLTAAQWIRSFDTALSDFARDGSRFVANFHAPVSESAPHIYLSALPFSPRESLISRHFRDKFPETLAVIEGRDDHWPALVNVFSCHKRDVLSVAYSPDGKQVASSSEDTTLNVWDAETGQTVADPFRGHTGLVSSVSYSRDGQRIASGSADKTVCVWDSATGHIVAAFEGHTGTVWSVAYSCDGKHIVSGSADRTIRVWNAETSQIAAGPLEGHTGDVWSVACSPDGKQVASCSSDGTIRVWDVWDAETGEVADGEIGEVAASPFKGHTGRVFSVAYAPDGRRIVSGSADMTVRVWDAASGRLVTTLEGHRGSVWSVAYSPDGKRVVSGSSDMTVCVWDVESRQWAAGPFIGHTRSVWSVAYSPNGMWVISGSEDETVCVWDVQTTRVVASPFAGREVNSVTFSPDRKKVVARLADQTVVWDVQTGQVVENPSDKLTSSHSPAAQSTSVRTEVSASGDMSICVRDDETGQVVAGPFEFDGYAEPMHSIGHSSDGKLIVTVSADRAIYVWDFHASHFTTGVVEGQTDPDQSDRHLVALHSVGGANVFGSWRQRDSNGWTSLGSPSPTPGDGQPEHRSLVFWVPPQARQGLCDAKTVFPLGVRRTQVDLSRFVHGRLWTDCHSYGG